MEENILKVATQLNNLSMTYDYKDWESILTSSAGDILKSDVKTSSKNTFAWLQVHTITELYETSLFIKLPEVQETSCTLTHAKFCMDRLTGKFTLLFIVIIL